MKAERKEPKHEFIPVVLTLETQEEVDQVFSLLNFTTIRQTVDLEQFIGQHLEPYASDKYIKYHDALSALLYEKG